MGNKRQEQMISLHHKGSYHKGPVMVSVFNTFINYPEKQVSYRVKFADDNKSAQ